MHLLQVFRFSVLLMLTLALGCSKEKYTSLSTDMIEGNEAWLMDIGPSSLKPFEIESSLPSLTISQGRQAMAFAISMEMNANPAMRDLIYLTMEPNSTRFREVVLGLFIHKEIPNQGATVGEVINIQLKKLDYFRDQANPIEHLLLNDPLAVLVIKHEYAHSLLDDILKNTLPLLVFTPETNYLHYGPDMLPIPAEVNDVLSIQVADAQVNKLFDPFEKTYIEGAIAFETMHGFPLGFCEYLASYIDNLPEYPFMPGFKIVDIKFDVQDNLSQCYDHDIPSHLTANTANTRNNKWLDCPRGYIQNDLSHPFDWLTKNNLSNGTYLHSFRLSNLAAFAHIFSEPCNKWNKNGTSAFLWVWPFALDGEIQPQTRRCVQHVYSSDLLRFSFKTYAPFKWLRWLIIAKLSDKDLVFYRMPLFMGIFSDVKTSNQWSLELNGQKTLTTVYWAQLEPCELNAPNYYTFDYNIPYLAYFQSIDATADGKLHFNYVHTDFRDVPYSVSGGMIYSLGNATVEYCHPYLPFHDWPKEGYWMQQNTTGTIVTRWYAPYWND